MTIKSLAFPFLLALTLIISHCGSTTSSTTTTNTAAPTVVSIKDSDGTEITIGSTVAVSSSYVVLFSKAMDPDSITAASFTLTCNSVAVAGTLTASADNMTFTFVPTSPLSSSVSCTLTLVGGADGIKDAAGNPLTATTTTYTFTTAAADTTPPTIISLKDSNDTAIETTGSTVAVSSAFVLTFSEAMDADTITADSVALLCHDAAVAGAIAASTDNTEFTFTPTASFSQSVSCTLTVMGGTTGVTDAAGNPLTADADYAFTSGCSSSDDFSNPDSLSNCFTFNNTTNQTNNTGNTAQKGTVTDTNGQLKIALTTAGAAAGEGINTLPSVNKQITGDFSLEITVTSFTREAGGGGGDSNIVIMPTVNEGLQNLFAFTFSGDCVVTNIVAGVLDPSPPDTTCGTYDGDGPFTPNITLRITRVGNAFACYRKLSGGDFVQVGVDKTNNSIPATAVLSISIDSGGNTGGATQAIFDNLLFNSGHAVGQD